MEKFAGYIDYRWSEKVWWGEAPEGPCDCSKEIREYLKEVVREACRRAEPWPSDKPRLGVPNGITALCGRLQSGLRDRVGSFRSLAPPNPSPIRNLRNLCNLRMLDSC